MGLRLLKFDVPYPLDYLAAKVSEWRDVSKLSRTQYLERVLALKINYSDFYTHHLRQIGWEAEEFLARDPIYLHKVAKELYSARHVPHLIRATIRSAWRYDSAPVHIYEDYIRRYQPDVIFVREPSGIPSVILKKFSERCLLVTRLAWRLPHHWVPDHFDLIHTLTPEFQRFFEVHGVPCNIVHYGFDIRLAETFKNEPKKYDVSFIGNLGGASRHARTEELSQLTAHVPLPWWGSYENASQMSPRLLAQWNGLTGGIDMFRIYAQTKISLNAYSDIANNQAVNQRLYEVMGVGSFLLSKQSKTLETLLPKELIVTYSDVADCLDKIKYFLKNEREREEIARKAQAHVLAHHGFAQLVEKMAAQFKEMYEKKFAKSSPRKAA